MSDDQFRRRPPTHLRRQFSCIYAHFTIEYRVRIRAQGLPIRQGSRPVVSGRRHRPSGHIVEGRLVHGNQSCAAACLDRHVADRHPTFHGHLADRGTGELDHVPGRAGGADAADHREDQVLRVHAVAQLALDLDPHVAALGLGQALGRQHVLHLGRTDTLRQRGEGAVRGSVRVAADDGHARQRRALLRTDHVDDALAHVVDAELLDAEVVAIGVERLHLDARHLVGDALDSRDPFAAHGRHVVVRRRQVRVRAPRRPAGQP